MNSNPPLPDPKTPLPLDHEKKLILQKGESGQISLDLAPGAAVSIEIHHLDDNGIPSRTQKIHFKNLPPVSFPVGVQNFWHGLCARAEWLLLILALLVYLATRFIGLNQFPIYFFTDEAIQTNLASQLVENGFDSPQGEFLPTYLVNGNQYNLSTSVYIQVLPTLIFGKSVWVTRVVCVLFTLFAAFAVGLISKNIFKFKYSYLAVLILSITPVWFLHSRTAFETALATSFYGAFLYFYLMYRQGKFKHIYGAVVMAALTFYSYSPAQMVIAVTVIGLLFSDLRFHWQQRKKLLWPLLVGLVMLIPYIRFLVNHPQENFNHLQILNSYLTQNYTLLQKVGIYLKTYLRMLNPYYWFVPNQVDIVRHIMKGYGHFFWWSLPIVVLGLVLACLRARKPEYRLILIAVIAAPTGAALASVGITRVLFMVIPVVLLAAIALDQIILWLAIVKIKPVITAAVCLVGMLSINAYMVQDVLRNAPLWYQDYGLAGMQYGAQQLFPKVEQYIKDHPGTKMMVSSAWANGTDNLALFFSKYVPDYQLGSIELWLVEQRPLGDSNVFVVIPPEMEEIQSSNKFKSIQVLDTIPFPNGQIGFYFVKVKYADNIAQIFADEIVARHELFSGPVTLPDGTHVTVQYPKLDMGNIQNAFDNNLDTLIRTAEANPMLLNLSFQQPFTVSEITLRIGGTPSTIEITVIPSDGSAPVTQKQIIPVSSDYRNIPFKFDHPIQANVINISLKNTDNGEPDHVHLWEISFK